jgi:ATP-dependent Clp protease adaptor protein ClpS
MEKTKTKTLEEILEENDISTNTEEESKLILWNDDVNSFEWVESCLMLYLKFTFEKAQASAYNVHLKGKDIIKTGSKDELEPYKKLLEERGLSLTIEK